MEVENALVEFWKEPIHCKLQHMYMYIKREAVHAEETAVQSPPPFVSCYLPYVFTVFGPNCLWSPSVGGRGGVWDIQILSEPQNGHPAVNGLRTTRRYKCSWSLAWNSHTDWKTNCSSGGLFSFWQFILNWVRVHFQWDKCWLSFHADTNIRMLIRTLRCQTKKPVLHGLGHLAWNPGSAPI